MKKPTSKNSQTESSFIRRIGQHLSLIPLIVLLTMVGMPLAHATTLQWDGNVTGTGPSDGTNQTGATMAGNWNTNNAVWWNGTADVAWTNISPGSYIYDSVEFGTANPADNTNLNIGLSGGTNIFVNNITFSNDYTIGFSAATTVFLTNPANPKLNPVIYVWTPTPNLTNKLRTILDGHAFTKEGTGWLFLSPGDTNKVGAVGLTTINNGRVYMTGSDERPKVFGDLLVNSGGMLCLNQGDATAKGMPNHGPLSPFGTLIVNGGTVAVNFDNGSGKHMYLNKMVLANNATIQDYQAGYNERFCAGPTNLDARAGSMVNGLGGRYMNVSVFKSTTGTVTITNKPSNQTGSINCYSVSALNAGQLIFDGSSSNPQLTSSTTNTGVEVYLNGGQLIFSNNNSKAAIEIPAGWTINPGGCQTGHRDGAGRDCWHQAGHVHEHCPQGRRHTGFQCDWPHYTGNWRL